MSRETLKVLEMVAEGKISPEEGERLIKALESGGSRSNGPVSFEIPDIKIPKIDMGQLGEMAIELKNTIVEGARKAHGQIRRGKARRFFDFKDYPLSVSAPEGIKRCQLSLELRAGKMKLRGAELGDSILTGKAKRVPEEPILLTDVRDGQSEITLKHSLGRCNLKINDSLNYRLNIDNAAADSQLALESLNVDSMEIDNNAGNVAISLGDKSERVSVDIKNNAGNVELRIPDSFAVKIQASGSLSSHNLERHGLELIDGIASSSDWDSNSSGVEINLRQNVASFTLRWKRRSGVTVGSDEIDEDDDE